MDGFSCGGQGAHHVISRSSLEHLTTGEDIDFKHPRGLNKSSILELARGQWIHQHLNLLIKKYIIRPSLRLSDSS